MQAHNPALKHLIEVIPPNAEELFLEPFSRREIYTVIQLISKDFQKITAKKRLNENLNALKSAAEFYNIEIPQDASLDIQYSKLMKSISPLLSESCKQFNLEIETRQKQYSDIPTHIQRFLKPLYLKNFFQHQSNPLEYYNVYHQLFNIAFGKSIKVASQIYFRRHQSISEDIKNGLLLNSALTEGIGANATLFVAGVSEKNYKIAEEVLADSEKYIIEADADYLYFEGTDTLYLLKACINKGATLTQILTRSELMYEVRRSDNPSDVISLFEFILNNIQSKTDAEKVFDHLYKSVKLGSLYPHLSSEKFHGQNTEILQQLISILKKMIEYGVNANEITTLIMFEENFLIQLQEANNRPAQVLFLDFIFSIHNFKYISVRYTSNNNVIFMRNYINLLQKNNDTFLLNYIYNRNSNFTKLIKIENNLSNNEIPQDIIFLKINNVIPALTSEYINNILAITLLRLFNIKRFSANDSYQNAGLFRFDTDLSDTEKTAIQVKISNAYHSNSKFTSTYSPQGNGLESKKVNFLDVEEEIFINNNFITDLKKSYNELLLDEEEKTQNYIDTQFKNANAFPDIEKLSESIDTLVTELAPKIQKSKKINDLLIAIKLFADRLCTWPRTNNFRFLNEKIYESTTQATLITKFGIIQPYRQLFIPVNDAAKQLSKRY